MMISLAALLYNFYGGYYNGTPDHGYFETHTYERNDFSHTLLLFVPCRPDLLVLEQLYFLQIRHSFVVFHKDNPKEGRMQVLASLAKYWMFRI